MIKPSKVLPVLPDYTLEGFHLGPICHGNGSDCLMMLQRHSKAYETPCDNMVGLSNGT